MNDSLELFEQFAKKGATINMASGTSCVIYTRVSTKEQADNNLSLETQKKACLQYAKKHNYDVVAYFGGTYESAKTDERKEFGRMLQFVKKSRSKISYIIVYSVDRFSRSGANAIYIASELKKQGIVVISVTQPADTSTASGSLQQNIQFIFSQYDNDIRREKCMAGTREKLLQGYWVTNPPFGYDMFTKNKEQHIVVNKKGEILRKAFYWKAEQGMSSSEILKKLASQGVRLYKQQLSRILRNPFYCGLMSHNCLDGKLVEGRHEKLVPKEIFLKANGVLSNNNQNYKQQNENEELPLKRFLKCAESRYSFAGYLVKKKGLHYYKCNHKDPQYACNRSAKKMHEMFLDLLGQYKLNEQLIAPMKLNLERRFASLNKDKAENKKLLEDQLKEIQKKIDAIEERFVLGEIDRALYDKFIPKYKEEKRNFIAQLTESDLNVSNLNKYIDLSLKIASNLHELWVSGSYNTKQKLQYLLFPEGIYYDKKNDMYRTERVNSVFNLINSCSGNYETQKKGKISYKTNLSPSVAGAGLEPATFGL
jgi:site-specific DNA recombinase